MRSMGSMAAESIIQPLPSSELDLESQLETAAVVESVGDLAERRRAEVRARFCELGRVKEVDRFGAEGEIRFGAQRPGAGQGSVHVAYAAPAKGVEAEAAARVCRLN